MFALGWARHIECWQPHCATSQNEKESPCLPWTSGRRSCSRTTSQQSHQNLALPPGFALDERWRSTPTTSEPGFLTVEPGEHAWPLFQASSMGLHLSTLSSAAVATKTQTTYLRALRLLFGWLAQPTTLHDWTAPTWDQTLLTTVHDGQGYARQGLRGGRDWEAGGEQWLSSELVNCWINVTVVSDRVSMFQNEQVEMDRLCSWHCIWECWGGAASRIARVSVRVVSCRVTMQYEPQLPFPKETGLPHE